MEKGIHGQRLLYPLLEFSPLRGEALARGYEREAPRGGTLASNSVGLGTLRRGFGH